VRKAAIQGNALAQFNLGSMYAKGHVVPHDYVLAYVWFDLAVPQYLQSLPFLSSRLPQGPPPPPLKFSSGVAEELGEVK